MPSTTPIYGLPYPNNADTLKDAVKAIPQSLAQQIESTLAGLSGVPAPGAWAILPLNIGASSGRTCQYRKIGNRVDLRGTLFLSGGAAIGAVVSNLPVGFRPTATDIFTQWASTAGNSTRVDVAATGAVTVQNTIAAGGVVSFAGLYFFID